MVEAKGRQWEALGKELEENGLDPVQKLTEMGVVQLSEACIAAQMVNNVGGCVAWVEEEEETTQRSPSMEESEYSEYSNSSIHSWVSSVQQATAEVTAERSERSPVDTGLVARSPAKQVETPESSQYSLFMEERAQGRVTDALWEELSNASLLDENMLYDMVKQRVDACRKSGRMPRAAPGHTLSTEEEFGLLPPNFNFSQPQPAEKAVEVEEEDTFGEVLEEETGGEETGEEETGETPWLGSDAESCMGRGVSYLAEQTFGVTELLEKQKEYWETNQETPEWLHKCLEKAYRSERAGLNLDGTMSSESLSKPADNTTR